MAQERRVAPERRAVPRAAGSRRSPARPTRTANSSRTGTDAATRPAASAARSGQIRRDAERGRDARAVTERQGDPRTRVAQPPRERRRPPASAENHPSGGTPEVSREARASGRPAPTHNAGRALDSGRPQPQSPPTARRIVHRLSSWVAAAMRDLAGRGGVAQQAGVAAAQAALAGRNPLVAAIRAGFGALSTPMKILVIGGLVLLALLAPLLLLLLLLALGVAAVVIAVRAPATV